MNKKGVIVLELVALGIGAIGILALPFMTPRFRVQKANQICVETGMSVGLCETKVKDMSKEEVLEYIRDI